MTNPADKIAKSTASDFARNRRRMKSAMDNERAQESKENFSKESQDSFSSDERGSEDLMDMYEKGAFN